MTQRNFMNERYQEENRTGKTRKSSASAKPKAARAATVREPAPKTKKQKKEEARERERKAMEKESALQSRFEETETYKKLRRFWWIALVGAIVLTALSFYLSQNDAMHEVSFGAMILAYVLIIFAFYIDLGRIRKERKIYNASLLNSKSKAARKEQKKLRAEQREQEKEAAEKFEAAKAEEAAKKESKSGFFSRFRKKDSEAGESDDASAEAAEEAKSTK